MTPPSCSLKTNFQIEDSVLAWNEADGTLGYYEVIATIHHTDQVITNLIFDGEWIETTPEHPFYTEENGWVAAEELKTGMHVRQADGTTGIVWLKWNVYKTQEMYNLTVDTAHTFFVGDGQWLVHNDCRKIIPGGYGNSILVSPNSLGGVLATEAKSLLSLVKGQTDDLTIAIGQIRGNRITVINGGAPIGIEDILGAKRASGYQHAEEFLFNRYGKAFNRYGKALDAIGVSHWKGPCRNKCYPMFEKAKYWDVFFDNRFVK